MDPKQHLHRYLRDARRNLLWKLDGLGEYEVRRPMTPTGTNLLGLVKHSITVELLYFGFVFDRPFPEQVDWLREDGAPNEDMWARPEESRGYLTDLYRRAGAHADATIESLALDSTGFIPWWPEPDCRPSLHEVLVHALAETQRHLGHADLVREGIDGAVGQRDSAAPAELGTYNDVRDVPGDPKWWAAYRSTVEQAARAAAEVAPS